MKQYNGYPTIIKRNGSMMMIATSSGYLMTGGWYGDHTISLDSSEERINAHWDGYVAATTNHSRG